MEPKISEGEVCLPSPPNLLVLQWHITERCNRRCLHCYQENSARDELQFKDLLGVVEQFKELLDDLGRRTSFPVRGHINVTGGEPFIRQDFLNLLEAFHANKNRFTFAIFTNGSFVDEAMASRLRKLNPTSVQVSIEGTKEINDYIRGKGALEQTVSALKHLVREHIPSVISFTAHRANFREFFEVARLGRELGVTRVWGDRLIPWGNGLALMEQGLSPDETREFFEVMFKAHNEAVRGFCRTQIAMHRALQFLVGGGIPYHCGAGYNLIALQPSGDLYPCRRMPIRVGNLMETHLINLYYESEILQSLRNPDHGFPPRYIQASRRRQAAASASDKASTAVSSLHHRYHRS